MPLKQSILYHEDQGKEIAEVVSLITYNAEVELVGRKFYRVEDKKKRLIEIREVNYCPYSGDMYIVMHRWRYDEKGRLSEEPFGFYTMLNPDFFDDIEEKHD